MTDQDDKVRLREVTRARSRPVELDAAEPASPHEKAGERPLDTTAKPQSAGVDGYRRGVLLLLSSIVLALALYWASGYFVAYTDDAYVTSDFVEVAPYISGRIASVNVVDNQTVKKGELLATIDPTPFQLALNEKQAKKTEAEAQLAVDRDVIAAAQAKRDDAAAKEQLAADNLRRATPVAQAGFVIRHVTVGHAAWVWLDTYPWHIHRAKIQGIARAISREQTQRKLLPYVEPTTDWIRLERRFPVTLVLQDLPPEVVLHMGADARTLIVY